MAFNPYFGADMAWLTERRDHMREQLSLITKSRTTPSGGSESLVSQTEIVENLRLCMAEIARQEAVGVGAPVVADGLTTAVVRQRFY